MSGVAPDVITRLRGAEVVMPGGASVEVRSDRPIAVTIDRAQFDSMMADRALSAGAEIRSGERVESFSVSDSVRISTSTGEAGSRLLVGADGHSSAVAATVGSRPREYLRGMQADVAVEMECQDMFRVRMGSRYAPGFFTWEIPCGDVTRVGLCTSWSAGCPSGYLARLVSDLGYGDRVLSRHAGKIPVGPPRRISSDRVMLVGDAAAQVKPVSGGGIYPSMAAAPILAEVASSALGRDDLGASSLAEYDRRWSSGPGREIDRGMTLRRLFLRMDDADLALAGEYASREPVRKVLGGIDIDRPAGVMRELFRHPAVAASGVYTLLRCLL